MYILIVVFHGDSSSNLMLKASSISCNLVNHEITSSSVFFYLISFHNVFNNIFLTSFLSYSFICCFENFCMDDLYLCSCLMLLKALISLLLLCFTIYLVDVFLPKNQIQTTQTCRFVLLRLFFS